MIYLYILYSFMLGWMLAILIVGLLSHEIKNFFSTNASLIGYFLLIASYSVLEIFSESPQFH
jgi:predicted lipid-binding transport protein (Tim44 family)